MQSPFSRKDSVSILLIPILLPPSAGRIVVPGEAKARSRGPTIALIEALRMFRSKALALEPGSPVPAHVLKTGTQRNINMSAKNLNTSGNSPSRTQTILRSSTAKGSSPRQQAKKLPNTKSHVQPNIRKRMGQSGIGELDTVDQMWICSASPVLQATLTRCRVNSQQAQLLDTLPRLTGIDNSEELQNETCLALRTLLNVRKVLFLDRILTGELCVNAATDFAGPDKKERRRRASRASGDALFGGQNLGEEGDNVDSSLVLLPLSGSLAPNLTFLFLIALTHCPAVCTGLCTGSLQSPEPGKFEPSDECSAQTCAKLSCWRMAEVCCMLTN